MSSIKREEFFLVWESSCRNFIDDLKFSSLEAESTRLRIHVFLRPDTPTKAMPPEKDWIETHFSLTTSPYASDTAITAQVLKRFGKGEIAEDRKTQRVIYLVSDRERQYEELIANLKAENPKLEVRELNGKDQSVLEVLNEACKFCKLVFLNKAETDKHNEELHDYFCENHSCYHSRNRFYTKENLKRHKSLQKNCSSCDEVFCSDEKRKAHLKYAHGKEEPLQPTTSERHPTISERKQEIKRQQSEGRLSCKFCPEKVFPSLEQKEIHMRNLHKKCNCSCGQYFETRQSYLEHFYSVYPLACFENRKCPHRFQSLSYQAAHHKDAHHSSHPYYCVPCQKRQIEAGYGKQKISFRDEKGVRSHCMSLGHKEEEMYFTAKEKDLQHQRPLGNGTLLRPSPTRACSNINYC